MKTVSMIPIKLESERVPLKNIKKFYDGTPLINFIQKVCIESKYIDETYVYCSDESIRGYLLPGIKFLKRPKSLDLNTANCNTIIAEFIKEVDADIYVATHATAPFSKSETIDFCIEKVRSGEYDSAFCAESIKSFLWQKGKPLNFDVQNFPRTQDLPLIYAEAAVAYVFSKETFIKYGRRVGDNPYIHEIDKIEAIDIDYPIDFDIANAVYKEIVKNENTNQ
jgi:CMP-N-acetylneuraminic acid synthetase